MSAREGGRGGLGGGGAGKQLAAEFSLQDSGPQSSPIMPSLTPSALVAVAISPSSPNLEDVTKSVEHAVREWRLARRAEETGGAAACGTLLPRCRCPGPAHRRAG